MKPILMRHVEPLSESFKAWKNEKPYLHNPWHYHPEFEITFITKGNAVISDKVLNYADTKLLPTLKTNLLYLYVVVNL